MTLIVSKSTNVILWKYYMWTTFVSKRMPTDFSPFFLIKGFFYLCDNSDDMLIFKSHFFKDFISLFLEGRGERNRERETSVCGCLSCTPCWGPGPQSRHVPWLGIEPAILWFTGRHSIYWVIPARAKSHFFKDKAPCNLLNGEKVALLLMCLLLICLQNTSMALVFRI